MDLTFWEIKKKDYEFKKELNEKYCVDGLNLEILAAKKDDYSFKNLSFYDLFFSNEIEPYKNLKDIEKAAKRIKAAIEKKEKVAVFADYDCDGVCSAALLERFFRKFAVEVIYHIPERNEGYGLNFSIINSFKEKGASLIITVDNGIVAFEEAKYIRSLGIDLIITDHHNAKEELPEAYAVINPKRQDDLTKFKEISGAFVAFELVAALEEKPCEEILDCYKDLVMLSTIGDVMPLVYENRFVVKKALEDIEKTACVGLKSLLEMLFKDLGDISSVDIAFFVCPKINATGRLNNAKLSFFLLTETNYEKARYLARQIILYNDKRKKLEEEMLKEAIEIILKGEEKSNILVVYKKDWLAGLTGIVAARLVEKFKKPAIVFSKQDDVLVGSARSFEGFLIYDILDSCSEFFVRWGGHDFAAGLSLKEENFEKFKEKIFSLTKNIEKPLKKMKIDCNINPAEIDVENVKALKNIGPFGHKNKEPIFLIDGVALEKIVSIGEDKHLKLFFNFDGFVFQALFFNMPIDRFYFKVGEKFKVLVGLSVNCFREVESVCYKILDIRPYNLNQDEVVFEFYEFLKLEGGFNNALNKTEKVSCPKREEFIYIYKLLKRFKIFNGGLYDLYMLVFRKVGYFKLGVILKIFLSIGVLKKEKESLIFLETNKKINLKDQQILKEIEG